jgi:hypothetical protein
VTLLAESNRLTCIAHTVLLVAIDAVENVLVTLTTVPISSGLFDSVTVTLIELEPDVDTIPIITGKSVPISEPPNEVTFAPLMSPTRFHSRVMSTCCCWMMRSNAKLLATGSDGSRRPLILHLDS